MANERSGKGLRKAGRAIGWIGLILVGVFLCRICQIVREYGSFPNSSRYSSQLDCPNSEIQSVIVEYISQLDHLEQASRVIIRDNRASHKDGSPPSTFERIFDWHRAKYLANPKNIPKMAAQLCNGPTITVNGKLMAGIPTIVSELTHSSMTDLRVDDLELVACAVVSSPGGVRKYIVSSHAYSSNKEALRQKCGM